MFKTNNKNTTPERSGVFIIYFGHISRLFLEFLLLTFEQLNVSWVDYWRLPLFHDIGLN